MENIRRNLLNKSLKQFVFCLFLIVGALLLLAYDLFYNSASAKSFAFFVVVIFILALSMTICFIMFQYLNLKKQLSPIKKFLDTGKKASQIVHDIKNPLSGIYVVHSFLTKVSDDVPRLAEAANLLELSTNRLKNIANNALKSYSTPNFKNIETVDLHYVFDCLVGEYSAQPDLKNIKFSKKYYSSSVVIPGKKEMMERVMANLIKNAIEAMNEIGEIKISTHVEGSQAYVAIQDNGPGMSQEMIASILNREGKTKGKKNGHGIGLQMVLDTIKEHKGSLNIESIEGEGAKFIVTLPYAPELSKPFSIEVNKGSKVVVIDSDVQSLDSWEAKLKEHNIETELFTSYEEYFSSTRHCEAEGRSNPEPPTLITDYYFEKSTHNGFQIVEELTKKGFTRMYVATKEYWKPSLQKAAKALKTKMCPKPLPPIEIELIKEIRVAQERKVTQVIDLDQQRPITVLVVDDEDSIHDTWGFTMDTLGVSHLHSFKSLEELQVSDLDLTEIDLAFVDKNIEGSQFTGAQVVDYLKEQEVEKVIVASGNDVEELKKDKAYAKADYFASEKIPLTLDKYIRVAH